MNNKTVIEKYKGKSFSEAAEDIGRRFKNKDIDLIEKNSYNQELQALADYQEKKKVVSQMQEAVKQFKRGGILPKYPNGGPLNGVPQVEDPWNSINPNLPFIDNPFQGMMNEVVQPPYTNINPPTLPQLNSKVVAGQMPVLGQRGVTPTSNTSTSIPQVGQIPFKVGVDESNVSTQPRGTGEMSAYTPALIGQGLSTALNLGILASGYDKVAPVDNPYESQVKNLMASRGIDTTQQRNQILSAYNAAKDNLNNTRSVNVKNALNVNMMNQTQDSLAQSKLQEQQINNNYKSDYGQVLGNLGQQKVQARTYAEDMTARNKATFENNVSQFGDLMAQHGESFSAFKANQNMNTALAQILNDKYASAGLGISQETIDKFNSGKATKDDWTQLVAKIKKVNPNLAIPEFKLQ